MADCVPNNLLGSDESGGQQKIQQVVGKITALWENHCKLWLFSLSSIRTPAAVGMELNQNSEYSGAQLQGGKTHIDQLLLFIQ